MRLILVLYSVYAVLFALLMVELGSFPNHPILIFATMITAAVYSAYLWEHRLPEQVAADLEFLRRHLRNIRSKMGDFLLACHFPALWGLTAATGTSFLAMFLGCSRETFFILYGATFVITLIVALLVDMIRKTGQLGTPTVE